ncbi:MAG: cell division protein FtsL [Anaplasma sp.]
MKGSYIALFCFCVVCAATIAVFKLKFHVRDMQRSLTQMQQEIAKVNSEIGRLRAEWTSLNRPDRLAMLAEKHLHQGNHVVLPQQIKQGMLPRVEAEMREGEVTDRTP